MNKEQARHLIKDTFEASFDKENFTKFIIQLLNLKIAQIENKHPYSGNLIPDAYEQSISTLERIAKYSDGENEIDILIVKLKKETSLEKARTMQRNFIAWYLNGSRGGEMKDAALAAFVSPDKEDWRFSLVKMDYKFEKTKTGKMKVKEEFTPARRWSFLVGENEKSHTAQSQLVDILKDDEHDPTLEEIEKAFDIETVTKEFFLKYRELFLRTKEERDRVVKNDLKIKDDFESKGVDTVNFAKKLLGQIVFLYFLQKKGWFGVEKGKVWGTGSKRFLRDLYEGKIIQYKNFFNDILEPLFYDALARDRSDIDHYNEHFKTKIPFLNGGLFDPINNYDWVNTDILLPDELFSNDKITKQGDEDDGILDVFDRYNFTVREDEPLEKEVAIDPELLGKAYEKFNAIRSDNFEEYKKALRSGQKGAESKFNKQYGVYYTPREIVHYMCQQSLISYLVTELKGKVSKEAIEFLILSGEKYIEYLKTAKEKKDEGKKSERYKETEHFIELKKHATDIDKFLSNIKVCDPAIGSGAFPVGMMTEIIKARLFFLETKCLSDSYLPVRGTQTGKGMQSDEVKRNVYNYKRDCIQNSLYGVDIDPGAVEIAKLRLWLSLIVDEEDIRQIKPLPNLDYKIVCGNSLLGVEKDLFNLNLFNDLEKLKPLFFNEPNPRRKQEYKKHIEELISKITKGYKEFDFEVYFSEVFREKKGFDVVIANPPYLGEKGHKEIFREIKQGNLGRFYQGKMDLFYFFLHLALNLGKQHSNIAFITTNYYPTATGAKKLRKDFKERAIIKNLINFNELKIFESALGQHNMITILQKGQDETTIAKTCTTQRQGFATNEILQQILSGNDAETQYYKVDQKALYDGDEFYVRIAGTSETSDNPVQRILDKVKTQGISLGIICNVNTGLYTAADKIFIFEKNLISQKFKNLNSLEKSLFKDFFKNSDIYKYYTKEKTDKKVLYHYEKANYRLQDIHNIFTYLKKYKRELGNRKDNSLKGALKRGRWDVMSLPKTAIDFCGNKIVAPQRSPRNTFGYNEIPWYAASDVFFITEKDKSISLKYILALINSKLYYLWLYHRGKRKGETLELIAKPLSEIPIKKVPPTDQKPFIDLVDKILSTTKTDDYSENPQKQAKVKEYGHQIDQMVYKLYGLTEEEIKIIEKHSK